MDKKEIVDLLISKGVDVNKRDDEVQIVFVTH